MANTTNFNWETPDDTDLVKDGAAAMRTLGNSIDSSMSELKGGTTGQVLSKTSNTDMDFTWVAQDDSNAIQNAIVDAKGDLIAASANDTPARLAVGNNGETLVADSSTATGLKWATPASGGGMTLLSTTTLTGGTTDISSISGSYTNLVFVIHGVTNATGNGNLLISPNLSLATNQNFMEGTTNGTIAGGAIYAGYNNTWLRTDSANTTIITIYNYAATTFQKPFNIISNFLNASSARIAFQGAGIISSNNAITSIRFDQNGGDFSTGTVLTYGVK